MLGDIKRQGNTIVTRRSTTGPGISGIARSEPLYGQAHDARR